MQNNTHKPKERRRSAQPRGFDFVVLFWRSLWGEVPYGRREEDRYGYLFVHRAPHLFAFSVLAMVLCAADAFLTLEILKRGGVEVNVFMDSLINRSVPLFTSLKMALTGLCLILLVLYAEMRLFRVFRVSQALGAIVAAYTLLVIYQLFLLSARLV